VPSIRRRRPPAEEATAEQVEPEPQGAPAVEAAEERAALESPAPKKRAKKTAPKDPAAEDAAAQ